MFGEFNEASKPNTSLAKYSLEFDDFAEPNMSAPKTALEAVRQTLHITVCEKL